MYMVKEVGHGGGIALLGRESQLVTILSSSLNYINTEVYLKDLSTWRLTGFYGFPERSRPHQS